MIRETSCGIIIFRINNNKREYLILHYEEGHFDFPKGHIEEGETELKTAFRELEEETGIREPKLIHSFYEQINYSYRRGDQNYTKQVTFFLALTSPNQEITLSGEHIGYEWLPFAKAVNTITYANAKNLLRKAEKFLTMEKIKNPIAN